MKNLSLHEKNIKIHNNLWKVYALMLSFISVYILITQLSHIDSNKFMN